MPDPAANTDLRTAMRHPVDYPVLAEHRRHGDIELRIVNISQNGFLANGKFVLGQGERVSIRLPVIGQIEAHLLWIDRWRAGFQLERTIRLGDFTRMFVGMQPQRRFHDRD